MNKQKRLALRIIKQIYKAGFHTKFLYKVKTHIYISFQNIMDYTDRICYKTPFSNFLDEICSSIVRVRHIVTVRLLHQRTKFIG